VDGTEFGSVVPPAMAKARSPQPTSPAHSATQRFDPVHSPEKVSGILPEPVAATALLMSSSQASSFCLAVSQGSSAEHPATRPTTQTTESENCESALLVIELKSADPHFRLRHP
jgi:hypothetical protein